ncbi:MAG: hypothetical protein J6W75_07505 [Bacteroidaceae bacterium]|nr:hypothetical protein [Bacteroidaceae bacterium]
MKKIYSFLIALLAVCGTAQAQTTGEAKGDGTLENPFNSVAAIQTASALASGAKSEASYYIAGKVVSIAVDKNGNPQNYDFGTYGNASFYISDDGTETDQFYVYRALYLGNVKYTEGDVLKVGDDVIIYGKLTNYKGDTPETVQNEAYLYSLNGVTGGDTPGPQPEQIDWTSSAEAPLTVATLLEKASKLEAGKNSDKEVFVKGKISSVKYTFSAQYGTAQFSISDNGEAENEFLCYGTYYLGNRAWAEGDDQIAVGDEVIVCGTVTNYQGTLEMANKKNYLYSLNGKTDGGDTPQPYETVGDGSAEKPYTVEDILHIGNEKENGPKGWVHAYIVGYVDGQSVNTGSVFSVTKPVNAKIKETANSLVLSFTMEEGGMTVTEKWTCTFEDDMLTSSVYEYTFPSEEMAVEAYQGMLAEQQEDPDDDIKYSIEGKVVKADATSMHAGYTKQIVKMVMEQIVEQFNDPDNNPLTPSNTNILIAAAPDVTDPAQCVPVQLANKLGMREALSLKDHPENLGKEVWIHGEFIKYFSVAGVKNVDEWKWEGLTDVFAVRNIVKNASRTIFNLNGQRVKNANRPGIYVIDGRKVMVK